MAGTGPVQAQGGMGSCGKQDDVGMLALTATVPGAGRAITSQSGIVLIGLFVGCLQRTTHTARTRPWVGDGDSLGLLHTPLHSYETLCGSDTAL